MFANPMTPNLTDYVTFLANAGIPPADKAGVMPVLRGIATSGSVNTLVDGFQAWLADQWQGYLVTDLTQNESASIASNDLTTLTFSSSVSIPVAPGDQYLIVPAFVQMSLDVALETVNQTISLASSMMYALAVYNLAADRLINFANDVSGQTYFADLRKRFRLTDPIMGIVASSSNDSTSMSYLNPEQMKLLTIQDLETFKTPYGRTYMGIAQKYGTEIWGLT